MDTSKQFQPYNPEKIRERQSYSEWKYLIKSYYEATPDQFFTTLHSFLDSKRMYKYARSSIWAQESLNQVLKDRGMEYDEGFFIWIKEHRKSKGGY